jgi:hypothetical protein
VVAIIRTSIVASYAKDAPSNQPVTFELVVSNIIEQLRKRARVSLTAIETLIFVIVSCFSYFVNLLMTLIKFSLIYEIANAQHKDRNIGKLYSLIAAFGFLALFSSMFFI